MRNNLSKRAVGERAAPDRTGGDATAVFTAALAEFFRATRRARGRAARKPSPEGLSLAQFHLLEPLAAGAHTNRQLAHHADVSSPTATRMIDVLVERGFVTRVEDPSDRRAVLISLTPAGRRALETKLSEYEGIRRKVAETVDPDERLAAADLLHRLAGVIEEL